MEKTYLQRCDRKLLEARIAQGIDLLSSCTVCPRFCHVDRTQGEIGFCKIGRLARVASWNLHFGEEDVLVGSGGSGTIFFSGCNLGCVFCQNWDISHKGAGREVSAEELAEMMLGLQDQGAENINFVTPSHVTVQILEALPLALDKGLSIPLVYNCGGYERLETLKLLDGVIDVYMPDSKFMDPESARKYCLAEDYPDMARQAIREMHAQVGDLVVDERGVVRQGLLVRHLLMPGDLAGTREWIEFIVREISSKTYVNIMNQYRPCGDARKFPELQEGIGYEEYLDILQQAENAGLTRLDQGGFRLAEKVLKRFFGS